MDALIQDLRFALRQLAKSPGFTAVAVLTLGLGIGVNTTVFSCVNALFLRPFPYREPERLVSLRQDNASRGWMGSEVSYLNFLDWQAQTRSYEAVAAYDGRSFNLSDDQEPERLQGNAVSWNTFRLLGISPLLGRDFREDEDRPGAAAVVILSHVLWQRRFAGDSGVIGRTLRLNGIPHTVIGVLPLPFQFPDDEQLWVPAALAPTSSRGNHFLQVVGRLKPGVSAREADAELAGIAARLAQQYPDENAGWSASVVPLRTSEVGEYKPVLAIMMGAVAFVLLIACANVANLLLARASARHREIAVRAALGAGRWRIVRQLLTESVLLALGGAGLGLVFALWGLDLIAAAVPSDKPFWMLFTIDTRVLLFTLAVAVGTGILFGLAPALQAGATDLHESLKEGARGSGAGGGARRQRLRSTLVVAEVALSLVLLIGATLMIRSFLQLQQVDIGFERRNLLTLNTYLGGSAYDSTYRRIAFYRQAVDRLATLPGATGAAATDYMPLSGSNNSSTFSVEGRQLAKGELLEASWRAVTAGYVTLMGIPLRSGRDLTTRDFDDSASVAVISETMARRFWPTTDALGKRFKFSGGTTESWITVVGIARDIRHQRLNEPPPSSFYLPYPQAPWRGMTLVVRTTDQPAAATRAARDAIHAVDPSLPVFDIETMEEIYRFSMWEQRLYGWMFGIFAVVALVLAAVGLYGVMAYMVTLRTHEIGVRMALGARTADVLRLVVQRGLALAAIGLAIGLVGAFGVTQVLQSLLYGVSPTDPLTFVGIPAALAGVALLASYLPARRAARVDPMLALRTE
jgi:putative ABC transport system permease protein